MSILRRLRELGRRPIVTSGEGAPVRVNDLLSKPTPVEDTRPLRLFIKNTALCKHESGRIGCDAYLIVTGRLNDGV